MQLTFSTFLCSFLHDYNLAPSYTFYERNVVRVLIHFLFTATHFHLGGRWHFSFCHRRYKLFMLFSQQKMSPFFLFLALALSLFFSLSFASLSPTFSFSLSFSFSISSEHGYTSL